MKVPVSAKAMSEKRFVIHDSSVEEYVESLKVSFGSILYSSLSLSSYLSQHDSNKDSHISLLTVLLVVFTSNATMV